MAPEVTTELEVVTRTSLGVASVLLLVVGAPGVFVPGRSADWMGWTAASPLAAAAAGALLWGLAACAGASALAPRWVDARLAVAPVATAGVIPLLATLVEGDLLHDDWTGWVWLAALAVLPLLALAVVLVQHDQIDDEPRDDVPSPAFSAAIALQASALLGAGGVAFLDPERGARLWPWATSAMDARVLGALAIALGAVAAAATFEGEQRRVRALGVAFATTVALLGIGVGRDVDALDWSRPMTYAVIAFVATLAASGAWALVAGGDRSSTPAIEPIEVRTPAADSEPVAAAAAAPAAAAAATTPEVEAKKAHVPFDAPKKRKPAKERKRVAGMEERIYKRRAWALVKNSVRRSLFR